MFNNKSHQPVSEVNFFFCPLIYHDFFLFSVLISCNAHHGVYGLGSLSLNQLWRIFEKKKDIVRTKATVPDENLHMQYTVIFFSTVKIENFIEKKKKIENVFVHNIDCGYQMSYSNELVYSAIVNNNNNNTNNYNNNNNNTHKKKKTKKKQQKTN